MKLYCRIYSSGSSSEVKEPPVIFLHGMGLSGAIFTKVAPVICQQTKRKVYIPDVRNHGKSPWVNEMTYDLLVEDVLELMQQNNIVKAVLVGSSMGGRIAMYFALKHPRKVDALIVEDMTPRDIVSSDVNLVQVAYRFVQDVLNSFPPDKDLIEAKAELVNLLIEFTPNSFVNKEKAKANYDPDFVPIVKEGGKFRLECNTDAVVTMLEKDALIQNLPELGVTFDGDTLFLYGSKGFFNLDRDPSIRKLFPRAIVKKVEDASHLIHADSPETYISIISEFILHGNLPKSKY